MPNTDIVDFEEALSKTGAELFKELFRIYPVADPEDYFKSGGWRNDLMKQDLTLIESHRREAGAPDTADIDDIKMPPLPDGALRAGGAPMFPSAVGLGLRLNQPGLAAGAAAGAVAGVAPASSTPVVEIRLIALFVAKWKLDPVTSKAALGKLTPARRRYIIQNFKTTVAGTEASKELEDFIAKCEEDGSWEPAATAKNGDAPATNGAAAAEKKITPAATGDGAAKATPAGPKPVLATGLAGLKRQLVAGAAAPGLKKPALTVGVRPNLVKS